MPPTALDACPKRMTFGPCGGVRPDGSCEVEDAPCVFLETPVRRWAGERRAPAPAPEPAVALR